MLVNHILFFGAVRGDMIGITIGADGAKLSY